MKKSSLVIGVAVLIVAFVLIQNRMVCEGMTVSGAREYKTYADTDYTNQGDISSIQARSINAPGQSVAACKAMCDATTSCTGFVQNSVGSCYLKDTTKVTTASTVPGSTFYYTGSTIPPPKPSTPPAQPPTTPPPAQPPAQPPTTTTPPPAEDSAVAMPPPPGGGIIAWSSIGVIVGILGVIALAVFFPIGKSSSSIPPSAVVRSPPPVAPTIVPSVAAPSKSTSLFDSAQGLLTSAATASQLLGKMKALRGR